MKEASGELSMTAITLVAIGALIGLFYVFIWPRIQSNLQRNAECSTAICGTCGADDGEAGLASCINDTGSTFSCPCRGAVDTNSR